MTRLSNRQYPMLKMFADAGTGYHMSIKDAQQWDQRPFRSMLIQKWVVFRPGRGFHVTREGLEAYREFLSTDIARKNASMPLTKYFDPTAYKLHKPGAKVLEMKKAS